MNDSELEIGVIGRPHGVRGQVLVWLHNPASTLMHELKAILVESPSGKRTTLAVGTTKLGTKGSTVLESSSLASREAAEAVKGWKVLIDKSILPPVEDADEFYYHELIGLSVVTPSGAVIGRVREVMETSTDVLVIDRAAGGELMVPMVSQFVHEFDRAAGVVRVVEDIETIFEDLL
jgi:16S rRNA processing protein RimM